MNSNRIAGILQTITVAGIVKIFFVVGLLMYCTFAVVVVRQVRVMGETIEARYNKILGILAWVHLVMAVGIVAVAIIIL